MITRRKLMMAAGALPLGALAQPLGALAHPDMGRVIPPRLLPRIAVLRDDGLRTTVDSLLIGRVTAVQLMFTGCSTVCPIQGALFAAAQRVPLVSLSVDPLADDPAALTAWLAKHRARALWRAAVPTRQYAAANLR